MKYIGSHCGLSTAYLQCVFIIIGAFLIVNTTTTSIDYATKQHHQSTQEVGDVESIAILNNSRQLQKRAGMRLCGKKLVEFITKICNDCIIAPEHSETIFLLDKKSQRQSGNFAKRSGLAEQCCNRRCDYRDLKMYCCSNH